MVWVLLGSLVGKPGGSSQTLQATQLLQDSPTTKVTSPSTTPLVGKPRGTHRTPCDLCRFTGGRLLSNCSSYFRTLRELSLSGASEEAGAESSEEAFQSQLVLKQHILFVNKFLRLLACEVSFFPSRLVTLRVLA